LTKSELTKKSRLVNSLSTGHCQPRGSRGQLSTTYISVHRPTRTNKMNFCINATRLTQRLKELNKIGALPGGGVSRPSLSDEDKKARDLLIKFAKELDLTIQIDQIGNIFCTWKGKTDKILGTGSHLDTVPTGGDYDGALGVMAGLEVIQTLKESGYQPNHSIVLANFTNEEGTRFNPDMMGSLAFSQPHRVPELLKSKALDNQQTVSDELVRIGYAGTLPCGSVNFERFVELHIEQGPILEKENIDIGIVEGVQSIQWRRLTITGRSAHAGTTPIADRKDAFHAMSSLALYARTLCDSENGLLITIGSLAISPNVTNVVPKRVIATIDLRHPDHAIAYRAMNDLVAFTNNDKAFAGLTSQWDVLVDIQSIQFDKRVTSAIKKCSDALGYKNIPMISGAGHDAQLLSSKHASAMIFIPSRNGVSHAVDEFRSEEQREKGANALLYTLAELDKE
jgi:beta-ureidopropionase / N-carbamoyl-L-amino-acid hydrolase